MSQSNNETKQRMIRLRAAVLLIAMISLPVMSAQVGPNRRRLCQRHALPKA
jgi:hypothetical protein